MITEIWLEGYPLDLYEDTKIRHTMQLNDVAEVKDRDASYTDSFTIPKTPNNIKRLKGLGIPSNTSRIPYQKPGALLKIDGFDFLQKAWLNVKESDDEFKIYIYSGIIEFFKKFENKNIGEEIALTELDHNKNLNTVIASQTNDSLKYSYLFADFNGRTHRKGNSQVINIDFVVPSVLISFLFDKIHQYAGYTFEGSFFNTEDYLNWWISYPKAPEDISDIIYFSDTKNISFGAPGASQSFGFTFNNAGANGIKITESGVYNFQLNSQAGLTEPVPSGFGQLDFNIYYRINGIGFTIPANTNFDLSLNVDDVVDFGYEIYTDWNGNVGASIVVKQLEDVSFTEEFKDLKITEFLKDVYNLLGLTPVIDNVNRHIKYISNKERFKTAEVEDWTNNLISIEKESYSFGTYAQKNTFAYKYNDQEDNQSDGSFTILNANLDDEKNMFTSYTYSVEKELLSDFYLNSTTTIKTSVYKLYEKEAQDGTTELKYKPLSKRYFYLRMRKLSVNVQIGSDIQNINQSSSALKLGEFRNLEMKYFLAKYYPDFENVVSNPLIWNVTLNVPYQKLLKIDLTKAYYFTQMQQYCCINKLSFDEDSTTAELVRIKDFKV